MGTRWDCKLSREKARTKSTYSSEDRESPFLIQAKVGGLGPWTVVPSGGSLASGARRLTTKTSAMSKTIGLKGPKNARMPDHSRFTRSHGSQGRRLVMESHTPRGGTPEIPSR